MKFATVAVLAAVLVMTGCAATGPKMAEMASAMPSLNADEGRVFFFRKDSMMGAALQPSINLDGKVVGESKPGGFFYVDTGAGSHEAMTSTEVSNKLSFVLAPGEVKYVRTAPSFGIMVGRITPTLVSAEEAKQEIATLSYTGNKMVK